jgi:hypothetical protein
MAWCSGFSRNTCSLLKHRAHSYIQFTTGGTRYVVARCGFITIAANVLTALWHNTGMPERHALMSGKQKSSGFVSAINASSAGPGEISDLIRAQAARLMPKRSGKLPTAANNTGSSCAFAKSL